MLSCCFGMPTFRHPVLSDAFPCWGCFINLSSQRIFFCRYLTHAMPHAYILHRCKSLAVRQCLPHYLTLFRRTLPDYSQECPYCDAVLGIGCGLLCLLCLLAHAISPRRLHARLVHSSSRRLPAASRLVAFDEAVTALKLLSMPRIAVLHDPLLAVEGELCA